jgi:ankyrin repeat protein
MKDFDEKIAKNERRDLFADALQSPDEVIHWANQILQKLEENIKDRLLESFFLPGSNLLAHAMYSDSTALMYVQMCRAFINSPSENPDAWTQLVNTVVQQLLQAQNFSQNDAMQELKLLGEMGLDPNVRDPRGHSPLHYTIELDSVEGVRTLMEWRASVENVNGQGNTAIYVAEKMEKPGILKYLQSVIEGK